MQLHPYQLRAVEHIEAQPGAGLFLEMGLGKTVSTLTAINRLKYTHLEISRCLVIAPAMVVKSVWAEEAAKWPHLRHLKIVKVVGSPKRREALLREEADIHLLSRDNTAWLCALYGGRKTPFEMLVIDELSSFKDPGSQRFKALRNVQFDRVVGLTGTPAPNSLLDLWPQLFLLDRGERLGKHVTRYREAFFRAASRSGHIVYKYELRPGAAELIHNKISDICISMKTEDYLQLPGRIVNHIRLPLPEEVARQYAQFERERVLQLFADQPLSEAVSAVNAAALANKLLQFANGAVYDSDRNWHEVHSVKIEAVKDIVEQAQGKPVLVAWTYKHDRDRIAAALAKHAPRDLDPEAVQAWNRGEIRVLMLHPDSGGHGLNLQAGGHIIVWFGHPWSLEKEQQLNARLDRQGQTERVIIHKLVAEGTLDEEVIKAQEGKAERQESLMQAIKARVDRYLQK